MVTREEAVERVRKLREELAEVSVTEPWAATLSQKLDAAAATSEPANPQMGISSSELSSGDPGLKARATEEAKSAPTPNAPSSQEVAAKAEADRRQRDDNVASRGRPQDRPFDVSDTPARDRVAERSAEEDRGRRVGAERSKP